MFFLKETIMEVTNELLRTVVTLQEEKIPYTSAPKLCLLEYGERETLSPLLVG